ncbi:MAG: isoleucine--tRNA ligase [Cyanobacteria bacterium QH_8_48_120]|nr:MAG: isoleucine--tRNA ligase [Cyanobacteria bacterium QS_1_48_34]PSO71665.1 MAG: isoleucine--tRNA ligase [Cyanobacteria bacterium QH_3_48_40]PSO73431.1 MAG: isoleucine--tRNA ligase [Cyanobacteria bacterium QH_8_48_120]PSO83552.1 MAG: isoleucine--tRNA ligase [Cyanobacteria bacterium QS_5_48_63]PSO87659.1 MAG: isoleucine--tRNA ligase [Cyanobacteria bacterium QH_9_48_43]PSP06686.1 MAG: isoleucine--tRNA ligase [Cyanobacteria bacterium SW_12_48_29]PSP11928.1 MAG: isoleucine--tRNA ligase [Cyanob
MTASKSYKDTVNLPKTQFPMRANAAKREPEIYQFWEEHQIYQQLSQHNEGEVFVLHDGPPYANGPIHMGTTLNKILKDIVNRYKLLRGYKVRYIPGWDCHGLPIELKVLQTLKSKERQNLTPLQLRQKARDFALDAMAGQRESFKRCGVWGDWEHPYLTMNPQYEAAQMGVFGQMVLKGYIYRGLKPVHWSPSSRTALAEAELEYPEGHTSRSIYAAFPVTKLGAAAREQLEPFMPHLGLAIWTTTPWTIPGNLAVAVNPELNYAVVEVVQNSEFRIQNSRETSNQVPSQYLIVAADLVERLSEKLGVPLKVEATLPGETLEHCTYRHPLFERESKVVIGGDYITTESGTGLVHTAPGHGQEDYVVGAKYGLPVFSPVDSKGNFTEQVGQFAGLNVLGDGNGAVIEALNEAKALLREEAYVHKYPYDWRTKKPTIFRATEQWFASVEGLREEALKAIASVKWYPAQGENRIRAMVEDRSDWCISRQRSWGVPIPVFYDEQTNEPLLTEETIAHVQAIIAERGSDAWWELSVEELLPENYCNNGRTYRKGTDTMDVWFDSGSSWAAVAKQRENLQYPADLYLEGSDQHRGWFQSSLLTSVATMGIAPYKTVLTNGFVLDEGGRKMSKSLGNVVDPATIIEGGNNQKKEPPYGADLLRLWVSSVDYSSDVPIGQTILQQLADVYRKIRNTTRFLLGNLHDFDPVQNRVAYDQMPELDRYMLHRITEVFNEITTGFENFEFYRFFQTVQNFCVVDLSNFYLDIAKDRLYISQSDSLRRRSCQTVLAIAVENLAKAIAPVACHTAEDIWQHLPYETPYKSVFESGWVQLEQHWKQPELAKSWSTLWQIRTEVYRVMEQARAEKMIGASLEAKVLLYVRNSELRQWLAAYNPEGSLREGNHVDELRYLFLASQVELLDSPEAAENAAYHTQSEMVTVAIVKAEGEKCDRCWYYSPHVGESSQHPTICERCEAALAGQF